MVRYYGRARTRTGAVNRNQTGLKLSGGGGGVGRSISVLGGIGKRVKSNLTVCREDNDKNKRCQDPTKCVENLKNNNCCGGCVSPPSHTAQSARGVGAPVIG